MRPLAVLPVLGLLALAAPAAAHPHIWIEATPTLELAAGRLQAIRMRWRFDDMFSDFLLGDYDVDGDGRFDAEETGRIALEAFAALEEFAWLTHLRVDGEPMPLAAGQDLRVTTEDRLVVYEFSLPMPTPLDVRAHEIELSVHDESYYIDAAIHPGTGVELAGEGADACSVELFADAVHPIYYGMVNPMTAALRCKVS